MTARIADSPSAAPMQSSVYWALLGLVIQRPSYGYELISRFEGEYAGLLRTNGSSQIYAGLDGLEKRGFVRAFQPRADAARNNKLHYEVTERGMSAYQQWLAQYANEEHQRLRLFAQQLALLGEIRPDVAVEVLNACERVWLEESVGTTGGPAAAAEATLASPRLGQRLQQIAVRVSREANLSWVELARGIFCATMDRSTAPR